MKAIILAAGLGTRLTPLTHIIPKCLAPIHGIPLLGIWLDQLIGSGIKEILINLHYLDQQVIEYVEATTYGASVTFAYEETLSGTGGTLLNNKEFVEGEPFLVLHGDNLCQLPIKALMDAHYNRPSGCILTMTTFISSKPQSCGVVELDNQGRVTNFFEKVTSPPSNLANGAIYILEPDILEFLAQLDRDYIDFSTDVIPHLMGKIGTWHYQGALLDIGSWENLVGAQALFPLETLPDNLLRQSNSNRRNFWQAGDYIKARELVDLLLEHGYYSHCLVHSSKGTRTLPSNYTKMKKKFSNNLKNRTLHWLKGDMVAGKGSHLTSVKNNDTIFIAASSSVDSQLLLPHKFNTDVLALYH